MELPGLGPWWMGMWDGRLTLWWGVVSNFREITGTCFQAGILRPACGGDGGCAQAVVVREKMAEVEQARAVFLKVQFTIWHCIARRIWDPAAFIHHGYRTSSQEYVLIWQRLR